MEKFSVYLFTSAFICLITALAFHMFTTWKQHKGTGTTATLLTWLGTFFLAGAWITRWVATGHAPYSNMYEFGMSFALGTTVSYTILERKFHTRSLGTFVLPVAVAILAYVSTLPTTIEPLVPALQNSELLTIHVAMAIISYGVFAVAFGAAVMQLLQGTKNRFGWLPTSESLEEISFRSVVIGFPFFAMLLILGAYWGNIAWGRYWGWDPKETSALATWLLYAAYLHTRNLSGWRGTKSAVMLCVGFVGVLFTYFAVNLWIVGLHSYAGL